MKGKTKEGQEEKETKKKENKERKKKGQRRMFGQRFCFSALSKKLNPNQKTNPKIFTKTKTRKG